MLMKEKHQIDTQEIQHNSKKIVDEERNSIAKTNPIHYGNETATRKLLFFAINLNLSLAFVFIIYCHDKNLFI